MNDFDEEPTPTSEAMVFEVRLTSYNMRDIARDIAHQLAERVYRDEIGDVKQWAKDILSERVTAEIEAAIVPIMADALGQPLVATDPYGKPKGPPKTAREIIADGAAEFLNTNVDFHGKPTTDHYSSKMTRVAYLLRDVIDKKFAQEMENAISAMKREVQGQMKAAAAEWLAQFQKKARDAMEKVS